MAHGVLRAPPFRRGQLQLSRTSRHAAGGWIVDELSADKAISTEEAARTVAILRALRAGRVGGEFWAGDVATLPPRGFLLLRPRSERGAATMLRRALDGHLASTLLVHTPHRPRARRLATVLPHGATLHLGSCDPWPLLDGASEAWIEGEDPIGLLALSTGTPVRCFASCDLSGWGLTQDEPSVPLRGSRTLTQAAHASLIAGVTYRDPFDGGSTRCETVLDILADWRRVLVRNRRIGCCAGISFWKRNAVSDLLRSGERGATVRRSAASAVSLARRRGAGVAVWTSRTPRRLTETAEAAGVPILHVEDGFLRSAGLGSNLIPPCSLVVDANAPHYAADVATELETLLAETQFDAALLARAEHLISLLNRLRLTKYNVGRDGSQPAPDRRRRVLVTGQVEDDLSIRLGGAGVQGNLDLLARARASEPHAVILFKPHPDVEAGHRRGALPEAEVLRYADRVVRRASMANLLTQVDAVHVLTSLSGFEALLRGREVVTHGQPFYAGWGLTRDLAPLARRERRLSLAELVAGALILYPLYLDPVSRLPCSPELLAARLAGDTRTFSPLNHLRGLQGRVNLALRPALWEPAA